MLSARSEFAIALALTCVLGLPARSWAQDRQVHEPAATGTRGELPAALQEVPAGQLVVSYVDSKLTIKARNAPFIDVLREVCSQLGTELDAPSDADDPVLAVWGPGPPREVLAALLRHSRFDYALAGSADDPNSLAFLAVFPRATDAKANADAKTDADADTKPTPDDAPSVVSVVSQMRDLLAAARAEADQVGQQTGDDAVGGANAPQADPTAVLDQIEAQLKDVGAAAAAAAAQSRQDANANADSGPPPTDPAGRPPGRRHRR